MIFGREIQPDRGELWLGVQRRAIGLLAGRSPVQMARSVPAAPGHTVHTLLVHLVGARGEARDDADLKPVTS